MTDKKRSSPAQAAPVTNTSTGSTVPQPAERVFENSYRVYMYAGWPVVPITIPSSGKKGTPPTGFTGDPGIYASPSQLDAWAENGYAAQHIALRMHDGVIGLDVDQYVKAGVTKTGATTLAECEAKWGKLPPTWCSTARGSDDGPGPSRILFFRVPHGRYITKLPDIEIIQRHHRYAIVAPSRNPEAGNAQYRWYRPDDTPAEDCDVPDPADLPELPAAWVEGLREGAALAGPAAAGYAEGEAMLAALLGDDREPCAEMANALDQAELHLTDEPGSRHDSMLAPSLRLVMLGAAGHPGVGQALERLSERWGEMTAGEDREAEFDQMNLGSARKAVTEVGRNTPVAWDPCLMMAGGTVVAAAVAGHAPGIVAEVVVQPFSWKRIIGAHLFDPATDVEQALAEAVLARVWPMLRYASDANGWLLRGPTEWELHGDLTGRAVAEVAPLLPKGERPDPGVKKDEYTDRNREYLRRVRLRTNAAANAVAGRMRAVVAGGMHPSAVRLADLDTDPEVLWAGGVPWDLRASGDVPTRADWIDDDDPHTRSAAVVPDNRCPMPHWEALISAVWPDAEVRYWALRVLSIAFTGYADAALPILLGPPGTGKTTTVQLVMSLLGSYAHAANPKLLAAQDSSHDSIIFALKGRRLSFIDEGPREGRWAQERLKQLTGGGQLTGNAMNVNPVTFTTSHTLVLTTNADPVLTDDAVRRRARLIPCEGDAAAVRAARQALTPAIWAAEAPGVLAGFMREAAAWLADRSTGLTNAAPTSIRGRAEELAEEQDPIRRWLDGMCVRHKAGTASHELFTKFVAWCKDSNITGAAIPTETAWGTALTKADYPATRHAGGRRRPLRIAGDVAVLNPLTLGAARPDVGVVPGPVPGVLPNPAPG
jgi:P4 family phage/plasmid primase-like protien